MNPGTWDSKGDQLHVFSVSTLSSFFEIASNSAPVPKYKVSGRLPGLSFAGPDLSRHGGTVVAIITNHLFPGLLEGDSDVFQSRPPGINVNRPPLRAASFSGLLLLENESLVLEQLEGNRDNTGDHRVIVDDNQLFALVKLFEVGKGP